MLAITVLSVLTGISISEGKGWMRTWGDALAQYGQWVEQTDDGGFIITGLWVGSKYSKSMDMLFLTKINASGDTLWSEKYSLNDTVNLHSIGRCVQNTSDCGFVVAGQLAGRLWLLKMDSLGDTLWTRTYGRNVLSLPMCVRETRDSGYITVLQKNKPAQPGSTECWLFRTDSHGDTLWTRSYKGNSIRCGGCSLSVLGDGSYIIAGFNEIGVWLMHCDDKGNSLWSSNYVLGKGDMSDIGYGVGQTSDGGYIVSGVADDGGIFTSGALFLLKTDSLGDSLWTKIYDPTTRWDAGASVHQTSDGGYIAAGTQGYSMQRTGKIWLIKTDSEGDMLWERTFDGDPDARGDCLALCSDGGYAITGFASVNGSTDIILIKTDSLGYVGGKESSSPLPPPPVWDVASAVGPEIVLKYKYLPQGFALIIFEASGRKADEIYPQGSSGELRWGKDYAPGVYVIREKQGSRAKVVLIR